MDTTPSDSSSDQQSARNDDSMSERLIEGLSSHAVFMLDAGGTITTWPDPAATLYDPSQKETFEAALTTAAEFTDAQSGQSRFGEF